MRTFTRHSIAPLLITLALTLATANAQTTPPDATLYTSYFANGGYQNFTWIICGSTQQTEGCYSFGTLGPFGHAGALIEGNPFVSGNVVTRSIYVVDTASGTSGTGVTLFVYKKVDTISTTYDSATVTLTRKVNLPLVGGATVQAQLAANNGFLFIGTDASTQAVRVAKSTLAIGTIGGFSPPINVSSITSDKYGYVTVTFGNFTSGSNGFVQFAPNGSPVGDGGGAWFMLGTTAGFSTSSVPPSDTIPETLIHVRPKQTEP